MQFTLITILLTSVVCATAYNILMVHPFSSKSHKIAFDPVIEELVKRGHKATLVSGLKPSDVKQTGIEEIHLKSCEKVFNAHDFNFFDGDMSDSKVRQKFLELVLDMSAAFYEERFVQDLIRQPRDKQTNEPKYDLVMIDTIFNEFTLPLAYVMNVPSIYFSPGPMLPPIAHALNIPYPLSYIPTGFIVVLGQMNFIQRAYNLLFSTMFTYMRSSSMHAHYDRVVAKYIQDVPPISVLERNVSFVLENMKLPLIRSAPSMPYSVSVGGLHCKPAKKLPQDLENFLQSSGDHGTIYFSLGSYTKGDAMPSEMKRKILEVFRQLPQKILWKHETDIEGLPSNTKLVKWAPQQDLLGHPKLKLFISHGGAMSIQEACYHGCPILAFPLSADQLGNTATAVAAGFVEYIDWKSFTATELLEKIRKLTDDKRYKDNAIKASSIFRDNLQPPTETAAYWIEYVIRHKGAYHLKSGADHLNFFQYFYLDIFGVLFIILIVVLVVSFYSIKKVFKILYRRFKPNNKEKHKKQ